MQKIGTVTKEVNSEPSDKREMWDLKLSLKAVFQLTV